MYMQCMYVYYVCINIAIMNKCKISTFFKFSVQYSPPNECLPDNSVHQESFVEVQDEVED